MQLYDLMFIAFFCCMVFALWVIQLFGKKTAALKHISRIQIFVLLTMSLIIIGMQDFRFLLIITCIIISTYVIGYEIEKRRSNTIKKLLLILGIGVSLCALSIFKYYNFFVSAFSRLIHADFVSLNLILPVGISFYTFTAISYIVDVYKKRVEAETNFINFALYISFFPKLVAGPIVRPNDFLFQIRNYKGIKWKNVEVGIQIFVFGLFKKIVLADHLNVFVNDVYKAPNAFSSATILLAVISYSLQIYFDFSGYSDMAIGMAKIVGIETKRNFNLPYISQNISEFWNRWHISLSSWFRDYLYIPLGGNRKGRTRTYINLMFVMFFSGLWHGAGWTFIIWGLLHGLLSCINRMAVHTKWYNSSNILIRVLRTMITFIVVSFLWIFFRANDLNNAMEIIRGLFTFRNGIYQPFTWSFFAIACLLFSTALAILRSRKNKIEIDGFYPILKLGRIQDLTLFFFFVGLTILMGYFGNTAFIYGKF